MIRKPCRFVLFLAGLVCAPGLRAQAQETGDTVAAAHTITGDLRHHSAFASKYFPYVRDLWVWLPPDYARNPKSRYSVLYLQDGQTVFDAATSPISHHEWEADETATRLIETGAIEPLIIVGIENAGKERMTEYTPSRDAKGRGGQADAYGKFLVEEVKPFVDKTYRTKKDAAHTGLGGSSLGGLATLYLGLKYPRTFSKLAVVSPSIWWDNRYIIQQVIGLKAKTDQRIWLDMGTQEGSKEDWEGNLIDAHALRDALLNKGWEDGSDLEYVEVKDGVHSETAWAARFGDILRFLFSRR